MSTNITDAVEAVKALVPFIQTNPCTQGGLPLCHPKQPQVDHRREHVAETLKKLWFSRRNAVPQKRVKEDK